MSDPLRRSRHAVPGVGTATKQKTSGRIASWRADIEPREPRCRICRHESVRVQVNDMLDWRGVPVGSVGGKRHKVTYADILRSLDPLNEGRDEKDRITYNSLRIHAKRHYDIDGIATYWEARMVRDLKAALLHGRETTYGKRHKLHQVRTIDSHPHDA